jgi:hypothetical protein
MKFSAILLSTALLATAALAAPRGQSGLAERVARRAATRTTRRSQPLNKVDAPAVSELLPNTNTSNVQFSSNWAGAVYESPPSGTFTAVSATITVPRPTAPPGSSTGGLFAASAWVGIDGDTFQNAILQGGVDFEFEGGEVGFVAWYEYFPDFAHDFSLTVSQGDVISMAVHKTSSTAGTVTIENLTTGRTVTESLTSTHALGGQNAEWIVEDFEEGNSLVPFADFGTVHFTGASASTNTETIGVGSAGIIEIESSRGQILTDVSITSSSEVTVVYA